MLNKICREARVLSGNAPATLLWEPETIERVVGFDSHGKERCYEQGRDWEMEGRTIRRTANSRIPDFADYAYSRETPCDGAWLTQRCLAWRTRRLLKGLPATIGSDQFLFSAEPRNPPLILNRSVYIDYLADTPDNPIKHSGPRGKSRIICLGDSIAAGAHTVAHHYHHSDAEAWPGLLREFFAGQKEVLNICEGGATIDEITRNFNQQCTPDSSDVLVLASGMNDHGKGPRNLQRFRQKVADLAHRALDVGAHVVLVGFFQRNPLWAEERASDTIAYNNALATLADELSLPFVDIYTAFKAACPQMASAHLTGDFMHHPNAYGQRIYFSQILPQLLCDPIRQSEVPGFVLIPPVDKAELATA